jgi:predicted ATPase/DNA-binding CsgD family transcriptional regulator
MHSEIDHTHAPFIGRSQEVAAVCHLLRQPHVRLLTITGPGGVGKTRLALHVAAALAGDFERVTSVSLAPIRDPAHVVSALAQAFGLLESGDHAVFARLTAALQAPATLLVLDNFEHLLAAAPLLADLLAACPALTLFVTSRATLRLRSEYEFPLPPLADDAAVALFVARARQQRLDFVLTPQNAPAVHELCAWLDRLPLAVELAAARIRLLSPQAMRTRLHARLDLLTGGARDAPARHRTLRATIAWSYDLLPPDVQRALRRLAVFVGGFSLEAADALLRHADAAGAAQPVQPQTLLLLEALLEQSLIQRHERADDPPRYTMLETIREFAWEQLEVPAERDAAQHAHARHILVLAEQAALELAGEAEQRWLDRLDQEHPNVRTALRWSLEADPSLALRLSSALWRFWYTRSYLQEGLTWLERALASTPRDAASAAARLRALYAAGLFSTAVTRLDDAERYCEQALELARQSGDTPMAAAVLQPLAVVLAWRGCYADARRQSVESVALSAGQGALAEALARAYHGHICFFAGELAEARASFAAALPVIDAHERVWGRAFARYGAGLVELLAGDSSGARHLLEAALELDQRIGNRRGMIRSLYGLGQVARLARDATTAGKRLHASLTLAHELGDAWSTCRCVEAYASLLIMAGHSLDAARLLGLAERLRNDTGAPLPASLLAWYTHDTRALHQALGAPALAAAWQAGSDMSIEQVLELMEAPPTAPPAPAAALPEPLTLREVEVLRLLARGLTDQQIAQALTISPRTVHSHLNAIYGKLGVGNRSTATRWAIEHGLT